MNKWLISKVLQYSKLKGGFPPPLTIVCSGGLFNS